MAQVNNLTVTSSMVLGATTENTSSAGYMWFDGTNFKYSTSIGAWSSGGNVITARIYPFANMGTPSAGIVAGGQNPTLVTCTEEYDGSAWTAGGAMTRPSGNASQGGGAGTQNAALAMGGFPTTGNTCTEEYNGSSWSTGGNLINDDRLGAGAGTQDAALHWAVSCCTEEYNGSSWSAGGALNCGENFSTGVGTQNAGLKAAKCTTEEYNGTSWSTGTSLITARQQFVGGAGLQDNALIFGGYSNALLACTEQYDGLAWSTQTEMITARSDGSGGGTATAAIGATGGTTVSVTCTEEYNQSITACTL